MRVRFSDMFISYWRYLYTLYYLRYLSINDVMVLASSSKSIHLFQKLPSLLNLIKNCYRTDKTGAASQIVYYSQVVKTFKHYT